MGTVKKNVLANIAGNIWIAVTGIVTVPIYIYFIGIEAYGLIGVFATLMGASAVLDLGLSSTLNREMARLSVQENKAQEMHNLLRTLEIPYLIIGLCIAVAVILAAPFIAFHWVQAKSLTPNNVLNAVKLMGLCAAFQWPINFYSGGLMGLQRQVLFNVINMTAATLRGVGAVIILWLVSPTVELFFIWQVVAYAIHLGFIVFFLRKSLPAATERPRFCPEILQGIKKFAGGLIVISITTTLFQLDKIILSRLLNLEMFGFYMLATTVAINIRRLASPVFTACFPKFAALVEQNNEKEIIHFYHKSSQLTSLIVLPISIMIAFFSEEIMLLWTQNSVTAKDSQLLVSLLVLRTACNCILNIPYALQLAYGWTQLTVIINSFYVLAMVPLLILFTTWYGAVGAASISLIMNIGYVIIDIPLMHRRLIPAEKWRWYLEDIGYPLMAVATIGLIGRSVVHLEWSTPQLILGIGLTSGAALFAAALSVNRLEVGAKAKSTIILLQRQKKVLFHGR
ncbi:MAG: polysaccharide biosynthesis protein [Candidatus Electrothrix sp. AX2]|nr:polysaccharide biosynthesis protein [Candidatus Electrothrix gigas]